MAEKITRKELQAASSEARNAALRRLVAAHPDEYRTLYNEEAVKRGVTPAAILRARRITRLQGELRELIRKELEEEKNND